MTRHPIAAAFAIGAIALTAAACKPTAAAAPAPATTVSAAATLAPVATLRSTHSAGHSHTASSPAPSAPALPPPPTAVTLGALTLAGFPSTTAGTEARGICEAWRGLRQQYEDRTVNDSPDQLNAWFSSSAWAKVQSGASALGNDAAYPHLETALGEALAGGVAGPGTIKLMDSACSKGD